MFMPNWSLKAEALYYDLGNAPSPQASRCSVSIAVLQSFLELPLMQVSR